MSTTPACYSTLAILIALAPAGCGKRSDPEGSPANPPTVEDKPQGCTGEHSVLVPFSGDLDGGWCLTVWQTFAGCVEYPPHSLRIDFRDPEAMSGEWGRGKIDFQIAKEDLVAGAELRFVKAEGLDGLEGSKATRKNADGTEVKSETTSVSWLALRDGVGRGTREYGWTVGTLRVVAMPAKKCAPYRMELDLELHDPSWSKPMTVRAPKIEFR